MRTNRRYLVYFAMFLMNAVNYVDRTNLSVAASSIASTFQLSPIQLGYMFSSFLWTYLFCLIPAGLVVDRFGARKVTALALIIWSAGGILTGLASSFFLLLGSRLILGIGEAASYPSGSRIIREWAPKTERGRAAAILNAGAYAGPALGGIFVGWLIAQAGWRGSFLVTGAVGVCLGVFWWILYRTPAQAKWISAEERVLINDSAAPAVATDSAAAKKRASGGLKKLLAEKTMWGLALSQGCAGYTLYLFLTWLPTYFERAHGMNVVKSSLYTAAPYASACVLGIMLGYLSDRLLTSEALARGARRNMIFVILLLGSVVFALPFVDSMWAIVLIISLALTCVSTAMSMNIALTNDLLGDPAHSGVAVGLLILGGNVFGLAAPIVTGYAVAYSGGFTAAFAIAGVLLLLGSLASLTLTRRPILVDRPNPIRGGQPVTSKPASQL
ncbi:MAG: major facilitator superfamily 1 [Herminiimonas sp.]|nr:major facilitator superfamily 1 [Herminiimonas sp.]